MPKILIAEDDPNIARLEADYLEMNGFQTEIIGNGAKVIPALEQEQYLLLLLDVMLPGVSGYDICRSIRGRIDIPILMVTARSESSDIIRGLGLGADDYITKPFDPSELVARVRSHLNRYERLRATFSAAPANASVPGAASVAACEGNAGGSIAAAKAERADRQQPLTTPSSQKEAETASRHRFCVQNLVIESDTWRVFQNGAELRLPRREFELLRFLAQHPNLVFSKEQLFEEIWGYDYVSDTATVSVHINRLREKIEQDPRNPKIIETVWGAGYRLNP